MRACHLGFQLYPFRLVISFSPAVIVAVADSTELFLVSFLFFSMHGLVGRLVQVQYRRPRMSFCGYMCWLCCVNFLKDSALGLCPSFCQ